MKTPEPSNENPSATLQGARIISPAELPTKLNTVTAEVLAGVARVLKPGGLFIIDVSHRDRAMSDYRETDWFEVNDLLVCTSRQFDPISGMNTEMMLWTDDSGDRHSVFFKVHIYTATELTQMLRQAGLTPLAYYGALASPPDAYPFDVRSRRLVIVAQKG